MATNDVQDFARELVDYFGAPLPPRGSNMDEREYGIKWLKFLVADLERFTGEEFDRAFKIMRTGHKYKSMPASAEILDAVREAAKQIQKERPQLKLNDPRSGEQRNREAKEKIAIDLMRASPMGRTSCQEGWCGELFAFVRDNGHLPRTQAEINLLIDGAKETDKRIVGLQSGAIDVGYRDASRAEKASLRASFIRLGQSMLARRDAISRAVVDGEVFDWGR